MSAPDTSTSPATPRNDAAERYSPPIADALSAGRTVREATKKSDVVRLIRSPQIPMPRVSNDTTATAVAPNAWFTVASGGWSRPFNHVGEVAFVALRRADVPPAEQHERGVDGEAEHAPGERHAEHPRAGPAGQQPERQRQTPDG